MVKNARLRSRTGDSRRRGSHCAYRSLGAAARARRSPGDDRGGAAKRLRPKFMTVATMFVGLIPIMWATGTGSDVWKRIAAPMVGGIFTSFVLELVVCPAIYEIWKWHFNMKHACAEPPCAAPAPRCRPSRHHDNVSRTFVKTRQAAPCVYQSRTIHEALKNPKAWHYSDGSVCADLTCH